MTEQELFDTAVAGLASQGFERATKISSAQTSVCRYRDDQGRKCAIGHCIPDEQYEDRMDGDLDSANSYSPPLSAPEIAQHLGWDVPEYFMKSLQTAHDCGSVPAEMKRRLTMVGKAMGLAIPEVLL